MRREVLSVLCLVVLLSLATLLAVWREADTGSPGSLGQEAPADLRDPRRAEFWEEGGRTREGRAPVAVHPDSAVKIVTGAVVVIGDLKVGHTEKVDGRMFLRRLGGVVASEPLDVVIEGGAWTAHLDPGAEYAVEDVRIRGVRGAAMNGVLHVSSDSPNVRVSLQRRGNLRVVDADSGADVNQVTIVQPVSRRELELGRPPMGPREGLFSVPCDSPVAFPDSEETAVYWVGAPGYEWKRIVIGADQLEATCRIRRCGSIEVRVPGHSSSSRLAVMLVRRSQETKRDVIAIEEVVGSKLMLNNIPAGEHAIYLGSQVGRIASGSSLLASRAGGVDWGVGQEVIVTAGEHRIVEFSSPLPWGPKAGGLRLRVEGASPLGWDSERDARVLEIRRAGAADSTAAQAGPLALGRHDGTKYREDSRGFDWEIDGLSPGNYKVTLLPCGLSSRFSVSEGEVTGLRLSLDDVATVSAHVRSVDESQSLPELFLDWRPLGVSGSTAWSGASAEPVDNQPPEFRFACMPGQVECMLLSRGGAAVTREIQLQPGHQEVFLGYEHVELSYVDVELYANHQPVVVPIEWYGKIEVVDSAGQPVDCSYSRRGRNVGRYGLSWDSNEARLKVSGCGSCTIQFPELDDFVNPGAIRVFLEPGNVVSLRVELQRDAVAR